MKKIFMNRTVLPTDTIKSQRDFIDKILSYELKIKSDADEMFWVSSIQIDGMTLQENEYATTWGKGVTWEECIASNYGELIERFSWNKWKEKNIDTNSVELTNLINNDINTFNVKNILDVASLGTEASGNNIHEARYHALCEALEIGFNRNTFPEIQIEKYIVKTENLFPELPEKIHNNFHVIVRKDPRISMYDVSVLRAPNNTDTIFMNDYIKRDDKNITLQHPNWNQKIPTSSNGKEMPWPAFTGRRIGLNIKNTVKVAIAELLQSKLLDNIYFPEVNNKKYPQDIKIVDAIDLEDFEQQTIEEDNELILNDFKNAGYNIWELNITYPECKFPTIKLIHDYSIGGKHPCSKEFLSKFFKGV